MGFFKKHSSSGFAVLEVLGLMLILGIIGGVSWYVVDSNKKTNQQLDNLSQSTANSGLPSGSAQSAKAGEKFVFKELGVQIIVPSTLGGMTYGAEDLGGSTSTLYLHSPALSKVSEECYGEKTSLNKDDPSLGSFGAIGKTNGKYTGEPDASGFIGDYPLKEFDGFYISGGQPNGTTTCSESGVDAGLAQYKVSELFHALTEALKTATLVE